MPPIRQPSFSSGEFAPSLWGRTDLPRYAAGLRTCLNFFISKQGSAVSRPGTEHLGTAWGGMSNKNVDKTFGFTELGPTDYELAGTAIRLIPFRWSDTDTSQNYVIEFGDRYYRIWKNGAAISNSSLTPPAAYAGGTTYAKGQMVASGATWYQSLADSNTGHAPASSPTWWVALDHSTLPNTSPVAAEDLFKLRYAQSGDVLTFACAGYQPFTISRVADDEWVAASLDFTRPVALDIDGDTLVPQLDLGSLGTADASHPAKQWKHAVTSLRRDQRGVVTESAPVMVTQGIVDAPWSADISYPLSSVIVTSGGDLYFSLKDGNLNHNPTASPLWWQFLASGAAGTQDLAQDFAYPLYPDMQARLQFANTVTATPDPNFITYRVYRGRSGVFGWVGDSRGPSFVDDGDEPDYSQAPPQGINPFNVYNPDGSLLRTETPISVTYYEDRLIFGGTTERPMFIFASAVGDYLNFDQRLIATDDMALVFALTSRKRELVRSMVGLNKLFVVTDSSMWAVDGSNGPLTPTSIDAHVQVDVGADWPAPLLIDGAMLWIRDKGTGVRGVAYDQNLAAFSSSDLSMVSEHLLLGHKVVDWCYAEDPWAVAWLVRDDGLLLSLTYAPEEQLWAWAEHSLIGSQGLAPVITICTIPEGDEDVVYLATSSSGGAAVVKRFSTRQEIAPSKIPVCLDSYTEFTGTFTPSGGTVNCAGLGRWNGSEVFAVYDSGDYFGPFTVSGGFITVPAPTKTTTRVCVGAIYLSEIETLDLAEARSGQKIVNEVVAEVKAMGPLLAGPTVSNLKRQADITSEVDLVRIPTRGGHDTAGRVAIVNDCPLPLTIRAVTRKVSAAQE